MLSSLLKKFGHGKGWPRYPDAGLVLLPWLVVAAGAVAAKYNQLLMQSVSDALVGAPPFQLYDHLHRFQSDLFLGFVVVPLLTLVAMRWIPSRWMLPIVSAGVLLSQIVIHSEMATYAMVSSYATVRTMIMGLTWAIHHPKVQFLTLPLFDKIYALGWIALAALTIALVHVTPSEHKKFWSRTGLAICLAGVLACGLSLHAPADDGPSTSIYRDVVTGLIEPTESDLMAMSIPELLQTYRQDAWMDRLGHRPSQFEGKARGYNVVMIVLESISAEVFDPSRDSLLDMPNVRRLRQTAFVSREHFTSYPLTNRASFGLFTSLYSEIPVGFQVGDRDVRLPSMIRDLSQAGYHTGYYGFVWKDEDERDDSMLSAIGFERIVNPLDKAPELPSAELMFGGPVLQAAALDHQALVTMRDDIRLWTSQKRKFFAAFFPEMGHDPWRNVTKKDDDAVSVMEAGHALAVYQDAFVGEVIDELQRDGALDHTIILITSDHGQRTIADQNGEEVLISHGELDERTMRVPLLIYVPKVLRRTVALDGPTSHIDVAPTLLGLLGIESEKELQEGTAMWNPEIARRRLFLPMKVFGASGYYENGEFYSSNNQGVISRTRAFPFTQRPLPFNSEDSRNARELVARHSQIQRALLEQLVADNPGPTVQQQGKLQ